MRSIRLALLLVLTLGAGGVEAQVRKEIYDLTAAEVASYRRGVEVMKSRDNAPRRSADFRRSWVYWTNVHSHFGPDCTGPLRGSGMNGMVTWSQTTLAERETWCTCEHGDDGFLLWHRIALFFFERVLREASGDPQLMVPYWNYLQNPLLPPAWAEPTYTDATGAQLPNPLFVSNRVPAINARSAGISQAIANAANAMAANNFSTFSRRLETSTHGGVHCALVGGCPAGYMGRNASAAADPIFWPHHANIDRIYEERLRAGLAPTTDPALLGTEYLFVSAAGARSPVIVRDMLTSQQLGVSYAPGPVTAALGPEGPTARIWRAQAVEESLRAPQEGGDPTLRLSGIHVNPEQPGTYEVFAVAPDGGRYSLGIMAFFAADHHVDPDFDFDMREAVKALGLKPGEPVEIVLEQTDGLTDVENIPRSGPGAPDASNLTQSAPAEMSVMEHERGLRVDKMEIVTE